LALVKLRIRTKTNKNQSEGYHGKKVNVYLGADDTTGGANVGRIPGGTENIYLGSMMTTVDVI
jgi:hypothetical protein